jgi:predicted HNH restriction endonuclease
MAKLTEQKAFEPALRIIKEFGPCPMTKIIEKIPEYVELTKEDRAISKSRGDEVYTQIVRNLNSHFETNAFGKHVNRKKTGIKYIYSLNDRGTKLLNDLDSAEVNELLEEVEDIKKVEDAEPIEDDEELRKTNERKPEKTTVGKKDVYKRDYRVSKTALKNANGECAYAKAINKKHITFSTDRTDNYLEAHHFVPMKAQSDFEGNLDRTENVIALCPNCHSAIHYGTLKIKEKMIEQLYKKHKSKLKKANIDIDLYKLIHAYYK